MAEQAGGDVGAAEPWEPMPEKVRILFTVFTYSRQIDADVYAYATELALKGTKHPRVAEIVFSFTCGYPTCRARNAAALGALQAGFHYTLWSDDDMCPDVARTDPDAKPFFESSLDFMLAHDGPCIVAAPYLSSPPQQQVLVMRNRVYAPDYPNGQGQKLDKFTIEEASEMRGITKVAALPTGLMMTDTRAFKVVHAPWFSYEYKDEPFNSELASTEDVVFSRNASWLQLANYCNWDAWAGHHKRFLTGKPRVSPVDEVPNSVWKAWKSGWRPRPKKA